MVDELGYDMELTNKKRRPGLRDSVDFYRDKDLIHRMIEGIRSGHIYVHLDLDVIDPRDFPNTPWSKNGE